MDINIKLYKLSYVIDNELEEYCVGTEEEVIYEHNSWVKDSGIFEEEEINDNLATTIDDLKEHWEVEQFYTFVLKEQKG